MVPFCSTVFLFSGERFIPLWWSWHREDNVNGFVFRSIVSLVYVSENSVVCCKMYIYLIDIRITSFLRLLVKRDVLS